MLKDQRKGLVSLGLKPVQYGWWPVKVGQCHLAGPRSVMNVVRSAHNQASRAMFRCRTGVGVHRVSQWALDSPKSIMNVGLSLLLRVVHRNCKEAVQKGNRVEDSKAILSSVSTHRGADAQHMLARLV